MALKSLPFDPASFLKTKSGGFVAFPEGYYLLEVKSVDVDQAYKTGGGHYTRYVTEIVMGPGTSTDKAGKRYSDMIGNGDVPGTDTKIAERNTRDMQSHKALWEACFGGEETLNTYLGQLAAAGQSIDAEICVTRRYIVLLRPNRDNTGNFCNGRFPYSDESWAFLTQQAAVGNGAQVQAPPQVQAPVPPPPPPPVRAAGPVPPPPPPPRK